MKYQDINAKTIDRWTEEGWTWGIPISHEQYLQAKQGDWEVLLSPNRPMPKEWIGDLKGKKILGLASGGGQQMPVFAAAGAICSVLDYSQKQIESEKMVAQREGYMIDAIKGDMTEILPYENDHFDIVFNPVSFCYVQDILPIYREVYRILKKGGIFVSACDNEINYMVDEQEKEIVNHMPFDPLKDTEQLDQLIKSDIGVQFSHSLEEIVGGQLKAGFRIDDIYEDTNETGRLKDLSISTYVVTKSVK